MGSNGVRAEEVVRTGTGGTTTASHHDPKRGTQLTVPPRLPVNRSMPGPKQDSWTGTCRDVARRSTPTASLPWSSAIPTGSRSDATKVAVALQPTVCAGFLDPRRGATPLPRSIPIPPTHHPNPRRTNRGGCEAREGTMLYAAGIRHFRGGLAGRRCLRWRDGKVGSWLQAKSPQGLPGSPREDTTEPGGFGCDQ